MKCPNDQTDMEKGYIAQSRWYEYNSNKLFVKMGLLAGGKIVIAWKCPKCGKIEIYTEDKK